MKKLTYQQAAKEYLSGREQRMQEFYKKHIPQGSGFKICAILENIGVLKGVLSQVSPLEAMDQLSKEVALLASGNGQNRRLEIFSKIHETKPLLSPISGLDSPKQELREDLMLPPNWDKKRIPKSAPFLFTRDPHKDTSRPIVVDEVSEFSGNKRNDGVMESKTGLAVLQVVEIAKSCVSTVLKYKNIEQMLEEGLSPDAIIAIDRAIIAVPNKFGKTLHMSSARALANVLRGSARENPDSYVMAYEARLILEQGIYYHISLPRAYYILKSLRFEMEEVEEFASYLSVNEEDVIGENMIKRKEGNGRCINSFVDWGAILAYYLNERDDASVDVWLSGLPKRQVFGNGENESIDEGD